MPDPVPRLLALFRPGLVVAWILGLGLQGAVCPVLQAQSWPPSLAPAQVRLMDGVGLPPGDAYSPGTALAGPTLAGTSVHPGSPSAAPGRPPTFDGTLRLGVIGNPPGSLGPLGIKTPLERRLQTLVLPRLFHGGPGAWQPSLAAEWKFLDRGLTLEIRLQPDRTWSDGRLIDENDVIGTFLTFYLNPDTGLDLWAMGIPGPHSTQAGLTLDTPGRGMVRFHSDRPLGEDDYLEAVNQALYHMADFENWDQVPRPSLADSPRRGLQDWPKYLSMVEGLPGAAWGGEWIPDSDLGKPVLTLRCAMPAQGRPEEPAPAGAGGTMQTLAWVKTLDLHFYRDLAAARTGWEAGEVDVLEVSAPQLASWYAQTPPSGVRRGVVAGLRGRSLTLLTRRGLPGVRRLEAGGFATLATLAQTAPEGQQNPPWGLSDLGLLAGGLPWTRGGALQPSLAPSWWVDGTWTGDPPKAGSQTGLGSRPGLVPRPVLVLARERQGLAGLLAAGCRSGALPFGVIQTDWIDMTGRLRFGTDWGAMVLELDESSPPGLLWELRPREALAAGDQPWSRAAWVGRALCSALGIRVLRRQALVWISRLDLVWSPVPGRHDEQGPPALDPGIPSRGLLERICDLRFARP